MSSTINRILGIKGRITIPFVFRKKLGFQYNDILSFTMDGDKVIVKSGKLCDNCKYTQADKIELTEFLDSLTPEEQYHAFAHLTANWAKEHGINEHKNL